MDFLSDLKRETIQFRSQNNQNLLFFLQPPLSCDEQTKLAVPKLDYRLFFSLVLVSMNIKIDNNNQVHKFLAHEGENIPSTVSVAKLFS